MREYPIPIVVACASGRGTRPRVVGKDIPEERPLARDARDAAVAPQAGHLEPKIVAEGAGDATRTEPTAEEEEEDGDERDEKAER